MNIETVELLPDHVIWNEYERRVEQLGEEIIGVMERKGCHAGSCAFDGYAWCEENDIPQSVFADAVNAHYDQIEWGTSPMICWLID